MTFLLDLIPDTLSIVFGLVCIFVIALASLAGIMSSFYRDNWLQFLGLWALLAGSLGRGWQWSIKLLDWIEADSIAPAPEVSAQQLAVLSGLALFAIGTAWKVWRHRRSIVKDGEFQRAELQ